MFLSKKNDTQRRNLLHLAGIIAKEENLYTASFRGLQGWLLNHGRYHLVKDCIFFQLNFPKKTTFAEIEKIGYDKVDLDEIGVSFDAQHDKFGYDKLDLDLIGIGYKALFYATLNLKHAKAKMIKSYRLAKKYERKKTNHFEMQNDICVKRKNKFAEAQNQLTQIISILGPDLAASLIQDSLHFKMFRLTELYIKQAREQEQLPKEAPKEKIKDLK